MSDLIAQRTNFRGFLVPSDRLVLDTANSTLTQASPKPGGVVADQDTDLTLEASGEQSAGTSLDIYANRPGVPDGTDDGCGLLWRNTGDADWRGHDSPSSISAWEAVYNVTAAAALQPHYPVPLVLEDGTVLAFFGTKDSTASSEKVQCRIRDAETGAWGASIDVYDHGSLYAAGFDQHPAPVLLPSGRILVFYWVPDTDADLMRIYMSYSDDSGATWSLGSRQCCPSTIDINTTAGASASGYDRTRRLRAAYHRTGIILMACMRRAGYSLGSTPGIVAREKLWQFGSTNLGASFVEVADPNSVTTLADKTYSGARPDVAVVDDVVVVAWSRWDDSAGKPARGRTLLVRLGSVLQPFDEEAVIDVQDDVGSSYSSSWWIASAGSNAQLDTGDVALTVSDTGDLYIFARANDSNDDCYTLRSQDTGQSWEVVGQSGIGIDGTWCELETAGTAYPYRLAAAWHHGRALVLAQSVAGTATVGGTIMGLYLGGWTTVTQPLYVASAGYSTVYQITLSGCWIPVEAPDVLGPWAVAGAGTASLGGTGLNLSTTAQRIVYTHTDTTSSVAQGCQVEFEVGTVTSTHLSASTVMTLTAKDGTNDFAVQARIGTTAIRFHDVNGASTIGTVTIDVTADVVVKMELKGQSFIAYVRSRSTNSDREWTDTVSSNSITDGGATTANNTISWGIETSTGESNWYRVSWDRGFWTGVKLRTQTYPLDLMARHVNGTPTYLDSGVSVTAKDGPAYLGDTWTVATRYLYAIERTDPRVHASPRIGWRALTPSAGTPPSEVLTYKLHDSITAESAIGTPLLGLAIFGANVRTGILRGQNAAGTWSTISTWDAADGLESLKFTRKGSTLVFDTGSTDTPHLFTNECAGWIVEMVPTGGGASVFRYLDGNSGGGWDISGAVRPVLYLRDADDAEPADGTLSLYPPDFCLLAQIGWSTYRGLQVVIDSQDTPDGYIKAGTVLLGPVHVLGFDYSWGSVVELTPRVTREVRPDGIDRVHSDGPPARLVEFGFTDGIDLTRAMGAAPTPDVVTTSTTGGSKPVATVQSTPYDFQGLVRELNGAITPVAFLDDIQKADTQIINRYARLMLARRVGQVRQENRQGRPGEDEVVNVATSVLEEVT